MLAQLRTITKGPVAVTLVLLVAAAFAIWGMPNMFSAANRAPAHVNGSAISRNELNRLVDTFLRNAQRENPTFTREQAIQQGVQQIALERLINERAISQFVHGLGISASDAQLAKAIQGMPQFHAALDPSANSNNFDPIAYRQAVGEMNFTVPEFEAMLRGELAAVQVFGALSAGARAPQSFAAFNLAYQSEQRAITIAEVPPPNPASIPEPTSQQIAAFYQERSQAWQRPERRTLVLAIADPSAFSSKVEVTDEQLRNEFERRTPEWTQPERRTFVQIILPSQEAAQLAATRLTGGADPAALAQEMGGQLINHDGVAQADLDDRRIATAAFGITLGAHAIAAQGTLAPWSAIRLTAVTAAVTPTFEEHQAEIRQAIVQDEAVTLAQAAVTEFEQQRRRRVPFADAATATGLRTVRAEGVSADGKLADGSPAFSFPGADQVVSAAFEARAGRASDWINLETGEDVSVLVESVAAASVPALAEVEPEVRRAWRITEAARIQGETAQALMDAVAGGQSLTAAARARSLRVTEPPNGIDRQQAAAVFGPELMNNMFAQRVGRAVGGRPVSTTPDGQRQQSALMVVVEVRSVTRTEPAQAGPQLEQIRAEASTSLERTLSDALANDVRARARVRTDDEVLEQMFRVETPTGQ